jgi:glycerol uptake facilitator-like aquaporin
LFRFEDFWIYIVGPFLGGGLAALLYDRFFVRGA